MIVFECIFDLVDEMKCIIREWFWEVNIYSKEFLILYLIEFFLYFERNIFKWSSIFCYDSFNMELYMKGI